MSLGEILEIEAAEQKAIAEEEAAKAATIEKIAADNKVAFRAEWAVFWLGVAPQVPEALWPYVVLPNPEDDPMGRFQLNWANVAAVFRVPGHEEILARFERSGKNVAWKLERWEVTGLRIAYVSDEPDGPEHRAVVTDINGNFESFDPERWARALIYARELAEVERPKLEAVATERDLKEREYREREEAPMPVTRHLSPIEVQLVDAVLGLMDWRANREGI